MKDTAFEKRVKAEKELIGELKEKDITIIITHQPLYSSFECGADAYGIIISRMDDFKKQYYTNVGTILDNGRLEIEFSQYSINSKEELERFNKEVDSITKQVNSLEKKLKTFCKTKNLRLGNISFNRIYPTSG